MFLLSYVGHLLFELLRWHVDSCGLVKISYVLIYIEVCNSYSLLLSSLIILRLLLQWSRSIARPYSLWIVPCNLWLLIPSRHCGVLLASSVASWRICLLLPSHCLVVSLGLPWMHHRSSVSCRVNHGWIVHILGIQDLWCDSPVLSHWLHLTLLESHEWVVKLLLLLRLLRSRQLRWCLASISLRCYCGWCCSGCLYWDLGSLSYIVTVGSKSFSLLLSLLRRRRRYRWCLLNNEWLLLVVFLGRSWHIVVSVVILESWW